jgi:hypothetical protein
MNLPDAEGVFVDTNVWVYATIPSAPLHAASVAALQAQTASL